MTTTVIGGDDVDEVYVLVGGWPGSGKSTLAAALAPALRVALLSKDEIKECLAGEFGTPANLEQSRALGRAAVMTMLAVAARCPGAVLDSTWFDYTRPAVTSLPGRIVEVRTVLPVDLARQRYRARMGRRHPGHLDELRDDEELWGSTAPPLGVGPLLQVDTSKHVDVGAVAAHVRRLAGR